jgi:hypothetical protein
MLSPKLRYAMMGILCSKDSVVMPQPQVPFSNQIPLKAAEPFRTSSLEKTQTNTAVVQRDVLLDVLTKRWHATHTTVLASIMPVFVVDQARAT